MERDENKEMIPTDHPAEEVSKRDRLKARLKEKYPDDDMDDDEVLAIRRLQGEGERDRRTL